MSFHDTPHMGAYAQAARDGAYAQTNDANFGIADFFRVLRVRRKLILRTAALVFLVTLAVLMTRPAQFATSAVVVFDPHKDLSTIATQTQPVYESPVDPATVQNQIQILTSRDLVARVVDRLKLDEDPEFNAALSPSVFNIVSSLRNLFAPSSAADEAAREREGVINAVIANLSADTRGLSTTITLTARSKDPMKAAAIANAVVDAYVADTLNRKGDEARKTTDWLNERITQLQKQVQGAEAAVQEYKAEHNLNLTADGTSLADQQVAAINTQLVQARATLAEKEANYNHMAQLAQSGSASDASQAMASPVIQQLREQEATLTRDEADLIQRYGPKHPKRIAVETQKKDLEDKIAREVQRVTASLQSDVNVARAQVQSLQASLADAEHNAADQNMAKVQLGALQANALSTRTMYEAFVTRMRETQDQDAIQMADARLISHAPVPASPNTPSKMLILGASLPAGFLIGVLFALLAERFSPAFAGGLGQAREPAMPRAAARPRQAGPATQNVSYEYAMADEAPPASQMGAQVLAQIPDPARFANNSQKLVDAVIDWPASAFAQTMAGLVRRFARKGSVKRVVAVSSAEAGEGKTTLAVSLARAAALQGMRAVVVDGDLKNLSVTSAMKLEPVSAGLREFLTGQAPLNRCLAKDSRSSALVLSSVAPPADPAQMLASPRLGQLLAHLKASYDLVIIDTPAVLSGFDAQALARHADAIIMVTRQQGHESPALRSALSTLAAMHAPPVGLVLAR